MKPMFYSFRAFLFSLLILLNSQLCFGSPVSTLGAQNLYNTVSKYASGMTTSSLTNSNGTYYFRLRQGAYDYNIALIPNSEGYVSDIYIDTMLPMLAVNELLQGDKSSGRYYDETYNFLRSKGSNSDIAHDIAYQRAKKYAYERLNRLETMFNIYGVTGNNVINSTGVMLLAKIAEEETDVSNRYSNMYYSPKDAYSRGITYYHVNPRLMSIINSGLASLYTGIGLSSSEYSNLTNAFANNQSSVYCSQTNRTVYLQAETSLKGDSVKIHLSAQ